MSKRNPSDAKILLGFDPAELEAAIKEAEEAGEDVDLEAIALILGVDRAWVESEYGKGFEIEIELDADLSKKLAAEWCLDKLNSPGGQS